MYTKYILTVVIILYTSLSFSQNCTQVNTTVNPDYAYANESLGLDVPFNKDWNITLENEKAIIALFHTNDGYANATIIRNKNGYHINSAHNIDEKMINSLGKMSGITFTNKKITKVKLKNILAKQVEFDTSVTNLNEITVLSGIMYMIVNDGYTYIFMFNSLKEKKDCYIPFFKNVMKNTYFSQWWY